MGIVELAILCAFGLPIVVLSCAFVVMAGMLQMSEGEREFAANQQ